MSDSKWTPGPWPIGHTGDGKRILIGEGMIDGPNGYEVAEVYSDDCPWELAFANASLIAAAPDLYAALELIVGVELGEDAREPANNYESYRTQITWADRKNARAALARARGEA